MCPPSIHPRTDGAEWFQLCKAIIFHHFFEWLFLRYFSKAIILLIATKNCSIILTLRFLTRLVDPTGIVEQCLLHSRLLNYCSWYWSLLIPFFLCSLLSQFISSARGSVTVGNDGRVRWSPVAMEVFLNHQHQKLWCMSHNCRSVHTCEL